MVQTTLAANLHYLLGGLAGPLANLFFCLCLGENITSNFLPEFDDLTRPLLAENMVTCKTMSAVWFSETEIRKQKVRVIIFVIQHWFQEKMESGEKKTEWNDFDSVIKLN